MNNAKTGFSVYLAGFMSGDKLEETTRWRFDIRSHYAVKDWDIVWLDPYNGKDIGTITGDGLKSSIPPNAIVHRDYACVRSADLIIANMDTFGANRPLTGTMCELAWAWQMGKPIILITQDRNYTEHPFMTYFASVIVPDLDTLLADKIVEYFYQGQATAKYTIPKKESV